MKTNKLIMVLLVAIFMASCSSTPASVPTKNLSPTLENTSTPSPTATPIPQPVWVYVSDLQPNLAMVGYWSFAIGKYPGSEGSMVKGRMIQNDDQSYPHGLFVHAQSNLRYDLNGGYQSFKSEIFIDESMPCGDGAWFQVYLDDDLIYSQHVDAPTQAGSNDARSVALDVSGGNQLLLHTDSGEKENMNCDATIWGEPMILTDPMPKAAVPATAPLEQQRELVRELKRFTNAMRAAGAIEAERSISFPDVHVANIKDLSGATFDTAFVHLDPDPDQTGEAFEGDYPLLINENGQWKKVGLRFWAEANQMSITLPVLSPELDNPIYSSKLLHDNATQIVVAHDLRRYNLFSDFKSEDWQQVVDNWDQVKGQLDQGILPDGFSYHWEGSDRVIGLADELNMEITTSPLLLAGKDVPPEIVDGNFNRVELENLFEFMLKVPMIKYRDRINTWVVSAETTGVLLGYRGPEKKLGIPVFTTRRCRHHGKGVWLGA